VDILRSLRLVTAKGKTPPPLLTVPQPLSKGKKGGKTIKTHTGEEGKHENSLEKHLRKRGGKPSATSKSHRRALSRENVVERFRCFSEGRGGARSCNPASENSRNDQQKRITQGVDVKSPTLKGQKATVTQGRKRTLSARIKEIPGVPSIYRLKTIPQYTELGEEGVLK